jgi:hypothetical protein
MAGIPHVARRAVPIAASAGLALVVWSVYLADRRLDALRGDHSQADADALDEVATTALGVYLD